MTIKQNLVPASKYALKCPNPMTPIGICVHNTANDASAKGEISFMIGNANQTSFHLAVDDIEVWQGLPLDRNGWHAGDGNGDGNRKHIGVEICYSKSGGERFAKAEGNAAELIAQLLKERNWGVEKVKKHQDFSLTHKYCPHRTLDLGWDRFINKVKEKLVVAPVPGQPMTDAQLRQKLTDNLNQYKDVLDFGPDKDKLGQLMNDPDMLSRIFGAMSKAKAERLERIKQLEKELANQPAPPPITPRIETGSTDYEYNSTGQLARTITFQPKKD